MNTETSVSWTIEYEEPEVTVDPDDDSIVQVSDNFVPTEVSGKDVNTKYIYGLMNMIPTKYVYFGDDGTPNSLIRLFISVCNLHLLYRYKSNACKWLLNKYLKLGDLKHLDVLMSIGDTTQISELQGQAFTHNSIAYEEHHQKLAKTKGDKLSDKDREIVKRLAFGYDQLELSKLSVTLEEKKEAFLIAALSSKDMDVADAVIHNVIDVNQMVYHEHLGFHMFNPDTGIWEENEVKYLKVAIQSLSIMLCELRIKYKDIIKGNEHQDIINKRFRIILSELRSSKFCTLVSEVILTSISDKKWFDDAHKITTWVPMNNKRKINWATGESEDITYEDKYLRCWNGCNVKVPNYDAINQEWLEFFNKILCGDAELVQFLLLVLAIYVSGDTYDKSFVIFHGPGGSNGKSVIIRLLFHLIGGDNGDGQALQDGVYTCVGKDKSTAPELVPLSDHRLCTCDEASNDRALNVPLIKKISGGDKIAGRKLYENKIFNFVSPAHGILTCNNVPTIRDVDVGDKAWLDRLIYFKFMCWFRRNENEDKPDGVLDENVHTPDHALEDRMMQPEYMNTLLIMLQSRYQKYVEGGRKLTKPKSIRDDGSSLMANANKLAPFIEERLERGDYFELTRKEAYDEYIRWGQGEKFKNVVTFGKEMVKAFGCTITHKNKRVYPRVRIRPVDQAPEEIIDSINNASYHVVPLK